MVTVYNLTPPATLPPPSLDIGCPIFACVERDIPLGESASVNNVILTKEHVNRLREMVASKVKLRRFLCSSSDDEVPIKLRKVNNPSVDKIDNTEDEKKEGECREFMVITYTKSIFCSFAFVVSVI